MLQYNVEQLRAIQNNMGPLLVLSGAGTGKTTTISARIAYLIKHKQVVPSSILALTFTNKAAKVLSERLIDDIGDRGASVAVCTFHSFAQNQIMCNYSKIGYLQKPKLVNSADLYFLFSKNFNDFAFLRSEEISRDPIKSFYSFEKMFAAFRYNLFTLKELDRFKDLELKKISNCKENSEIEQSNQLIDMLDAFPVYQEWKKKLSWIDYGDMIYNLWELINKDALFLKKLQSEYKHIIIDEFQDNNYALSMIVEQIAKPENNIMVVGDDDQCIYAFRQANIQNLHWFKNQYLKKDEKPISLYENYRSSDSILQLANSVIAKNPNRMIKNKLKSNKVFNEKPVLYLGSEKEQLIQLVENIKSLLDDGEFISDMVILSRSNVKCYAIAEFLNINGIRNCFYIFKLYEHPIIKNIIAFLNIWAETEKKNHSFLRLLKEYVDYDSVALLSKEYSNSELDVSLIEFAMSKKNKIGEMSKKIIMSVQNISASNADELIWNILKISKVYIDKEPKSIKSQIKLKVLDQFRNNVKVYMSKYARNNLKEFVHFINIQHNINEEIVESLDVLMELSAVKIMTIHSAKGMEFKHVFIPFLRAGTFPSNYKKMKIVDRIPLSWKKWCIDREDEKVLYYEEERRLFYVAITRAMNTLTLFAPNKYQSVFIKELNKEDVIVKDIMNKNNILDKYSQLIKKYEVQLQLELEVQNFLKAKEILSSIENINCLSKGVEPSWGDNSMKEEVENLLIDIETYRTVDDIHLSATSINVYNICPLKYKYQYIDKIIGAPDVQHFQIGLLIHKVLEEYHIGSDNTFDGMLMLLNKHWKNYNFQYKQQEEQQRKDSEKMLKNYWNYIQLNPVNRPLMEYAFSFKMDDVILTGMCDRIDIDLKNNITIIDYKTSKKNQTEKQLKNNIQLGIYALFAKLEGVKIDGNSIKSMPKNLIMLFLRNEEPAVEVSFEEEDVNKIVEKIKVVSQDIRIGKFPAVKGMYCEWCDYKDLLCSEFG